MSAESAPTTVATRVVVAYDPPTDEVLEAISSPSYRRYLRTAKAGDVSVGDVWDEFVSCGCGARDDVSLRVERVESGDRVGEATTFEFVPANGA